MTNNPNHWPTYDSPHQALLTETRSWGERLEIAEMRYNLLDGHLPPESDSLAIAIVDGHTERPENFSLLDIYARQGMDPAKTGVLLSVNFEGHDIPDNAHELSEAISEQRERTSLAAAVAFVGYDQKRRIDIARSDIWDVAVAHALRQQAGHSIVGLSNDADMVDASADYLTAMTQNKYVSQPAQIWGSEVDFSQPGGSDLPLHKLIAYMNGGRKLIKEFLGRPVMYGASMGMTLENYAISGSWTGQYTNPNDYGIGEPSRIVHSTWERVVGEKRSMDEVEVAYRSCAKRVGGVAVVSPRREIWAYAAEIGHDTNLARHLNTETDNPYRVVSDEQIAELAGSVALDDPRFLKELDDLDNSFLKLIDPQRHSEARAARKALRESIGLPL